MYEPVYPINFTDSGDVIHEAFRKHIQEVARIYAILNDESVSIKVGDVIVQ